MTPGSPEQTAGSGVRIRQGVTHPTLGPIGGWEGTVMRSFTAGGTEYLDVEMSPSTLGSLGAKGRSAFYERKIVFTRFRVRANDAEALPAAVQPQKELLESRAQREWFEEVGAKESDPTKLVADRAAGGSGKVDMGRRQMMRQLVTAGVILMIVVALIDENCNTGRSGSGSWGRSGGFSS